MCFRPVLLKRIEFLKENDTCRFYDVEGNLQSISVPAGSPVFSFRQVPIIYTLSKASHGFVLQPATGWRPNNPAIGSMAEPAGNSSIDSVASHG